MKWHKCSVARDRNGLGDDYYSICIDVERGGDEWSQIVVEASTSKLAVSLAKEVIKNHNFFSSLQKISKQENVKSIAEVQKESKNDQRMR